MRGELVRGKTLVVALAMVSLLGAACGGDDDGGSTEGGAEGGGSTTLTASDFAFDPSDLSAASGSSIEFTNEDDAAHTFTSEDAGIDEEVDAGSSITIDLGDVEPGTYDFVCRFHDNMTGTLEVT